MTVIVNGEPKECPQSQSLEAFIGGIGLKGDRIAVELNHEIIPRKRWNEVNLSAGDRLEIVHFVGGGSSEVVPFTSTHQERPRSRLPSRCLTFRAAAC
jgi:thiamine biosynthesis protein ThiS